MIVCMLVNLMFNLRLFIEDLEKYENYMNFKSGKYAVKRKDISLKNDVKMTINMLLNLMFISYERCGINTNLQKFEHSINFKSEKKFGARKNTSFRNCVKISSHENERSNHENSALKIYKIRSYGMPFVDNQFPLKIFSIGFLKTIYSNTTTATDLGHKYFYLSNYQKCCYYGQFKPYNHVRCLNQFNSYNKDQFYKIVEI